MASTFHRWELEPKITQAEIEALTHDQSQHVGKSAHFQELLDLLVSVGAFGSNVRASKVADLMYIDSAPLEPTANQAKAGKSKTHWGDRRFEKIRYGRASLTRREAGYFHDAFRRAFGDSWADGISIEALVLQPLRANLRLLRGLNLPGPWDQLNPVATLRLLAQDGPADAPYRRILIETDESLRISQ